MNAFELSYYGISYYHSKFDKINFAPNIDTTAIASPQAYGQTESGGGYKAFVGYQFNNYFAVEAGLTSYSDPDFALTEKQGSTTNTLHSGSFNTTAWNLSLVAIYPMQNGWFVKSQLGALSWRNEIDTLTSNQGAFSVTQNKDTGVDLVIGTELGYAITKKVAFSIGVERTDIAGYGVTSGYLGFTGRF